MTRTARQKAIRKQRRERCREAPRRNCPNPSKRAYKDEEAVGHAIRGSRRTGSPFRIYECQCGSLHLTRQKKFTPKTKRAPKP